MTFWRRFTSSRQPPPREPPPGRDDACACIARMYAGWARGRGLRIDDRPGLRIRGAVGGRHVLIDPGIDHRVPGWVQVTVVVALPAASSLLVTRATSPRDAITAAVRALFDDPHIGPELRAISVAPHHLRLRLAPGAAPDVVEIAVAAVARTLRALYAPPPSDPRQPCTIPTASPA
jgi:hypothetical protein